MAKKKSSTKKGKTKSIGTATVKVRVGTGDGGLVSKKALTAANAKKK